MGFRIEYSFPLGAKGTIFDPVGDGSGYFPRLMFVYEPSQKAPKASSNGAAKSVPAFVKALASREPAFGGDGYSATDAFRALYEKGAEGQNADEGLDILNSYANEKGVDLRFVDPETLVRKAGEDCQGYRRGNEALVGVVDYEGKPHSRAKKIALALHEIEAGYDHRHSQQEAQERAKKAAARLGLYEAIPELEKIDELF